MIIDELTEAIRTDFEKNGSYDRYPVRFFSTSLDNDTPNFIIELNNYIKKNSQNKNSEIIDFKEWLVHDDAWITKEKVLTSIGGLKKDYSYIIVGFSEYARLLSNADFITMVKALLEIENSAEYQKRRIYVPCFALYSQITKIVVCFHRRMDAYNPFLNETPVEDLPKIFFLDEGLDNSEYDNTIYNSSQWYGMWRGSNIDVKKPIICLSKTLLFFYRQASPDNVYNIKAISSYEELLRSVYGIDNFVPYMPNSVEFYIKLIKILSNDVDKGKPLKDIILKELNTIKIDEYIIPIIWKTSDRFKRWLLKNFILIWYCQKCYLYHMMNDLIDLNDNELYEVAYNYIFKENKSSFYSERKQFLTAIINLDSDTNFGDRMNIYYEKTIQSIIIKRFGKSIDKLDFTIDIDLPQSESVIVDVRNKVLPIITNYSSYERQLILWLYRHGMINDENLEKVYPELILYLHSCTSEFIGDKFSSVSKYFELYRKSRIGYVPADDYEKQLKEWNGSEDKFYSWYSDIKLQYPESILKKNTSIGSVYVFDGVGAEFLDYICALLKYKGYVLDLCTYGKSHLPTITSQAKKYYSEDYEWLLEYDSNVIHGDIYYHIPNLEKSLRVIKNMVEKIINKSKEGKIAIIADHGATVNHKFLKKNKKYDFDTADHAGRCYKNESGNEISDSSDYIKYEDEGGMNWIIALNGQSLYKSSQYEVHGGATPEEVIVPVIIVHHENNNAKFINYHVKEINLKVNGINKDVQFKIIPKPMIAMLKATDGTDIHLVYEHSCNEV